MQQGRGLISGMSRWKLKKTVVMVGMMGAGKTAVGTALARLIGVPFEDSDRQIEQAANMTIAEIFARDGEAFFREKESLVLARLLEGPPCILSTGGGAFLQPGNREMIAEKGLAVWLRADPDLLWSRVSHKDTRPLLRVENPRARLVELLQERTPAYAQAGLVVDSQAGCSVGEMAEKVRDALLAHPSGILEKVT